MKIDIGMKYHRIMGMIRSLLTSLESLVFKNSLIFYFIVINNKNQKHYQIIQPTNHDLFDKMQSTTFE